MKVLLLFPPNWTPAMPHLALPTLTAYLRGERGLNPRKLPERYLLLPELPLGPTGKTCAATLARVAARAVLADADGHPVRPAVPTEE